MLASAITFALRNEIKKYHTRVFNTCNDIAIAARKAGSKVFFN